MLIDFSLIPPGVANRKQIQNLNDAFDRLSARLVTEIKIPEPVSGFRASNLIRVYLQSHLRRMLQLTEAALNEFFDGRGVPAILCARGLYEGLATVTDFEKELKVLLAAGDIQAVFQFTKEKAHATKKKDWIAKLGNTNVTAKNVVTMVGKLTNIRSNVPEEYDFLSEIAHPHMGICESRPFDWLVFTSPSAFPNPQRLRIFMHEKGIADRFDETIYDMSPVGEQRGWKHLKMNPWGETPTLALADGSFLSETSAIARYLDDTFDGRKIMGATPHERGLDQMWDNRVWVHILYPIVTAFHVLHQGLGPKLELTSNPAWGEHSRKVALTHAALVDRHLADGREWLLGGEAPTFSDITMATAIAFSKFPVNATPLDERFEHIDAFWRRWQRRPAFLAAYADRNSGVPELDNRA